jgi:hypothetical protein
MHILKSKAIALIGSGGLQGCEIPHCSVVSLMRRTHSTTKKYFLFLSLVLISVRD